MSHLAGPIVFWQRTRNGAVCRPYIMWPPTWPIFNLGAEVMALLVQVLSGLPFKLSRALEDEVSNVSTVSTSQRSETISKFLKASANLSLLMASTMWIPHLFHHISDPQDEDEGEDEDGILW